MGRKSETFFCHGNAAGQGKLEHAHKFDQLLLNEMARVRPLKGQWKDFNGENPCAGRWPSDWQGRTRKSTWGQPVHGRARAGGLDAAAVHRHVQGEHARRRLGARPGWSAAVVAPSGAGACCEDRPCQASARHGCRQQPCRQNPHARCWGRRAGFRLIHSRTLFWVAHSFTPFTLSPLSCSCIRERICVSLCVHHLILSVLVNPSTQCNHFCSSSLGASL